MIFLLRFAVPLDFGRFASLRIGRDDAVFLALFLKVAPTNDFYAAAVSGEMAYGGKSPGVARFATFQPPPSALFLRLPAPCILRFPYPRRV